MSKVNIINIQKFNPKQQNEFSKEPLPYTQICNTVINKCQNPVAGFIWIYLQSKPETWRPCKWEIMKRFNISESTYKRHMKYLTSTNLIETHMTRNPQGQIVDWRIVVLNGSRFNPQADDYTGVVCEIQKNQSVKNDLLETPPSDKGFSQSVKNDLLVKNQSVKNTTPGSFDPPYKERLTSLEKKEKDPPISPKGGSKSSTFSLFQMLEDNPFNIPQNVLADWIEVRKLKRAKLTATAWNQANNNMRKLKEAGLNPLECFLKSVSNGWPGIEFRYFERDIPQKPKYPTADERAANEKKIREREMKAQADKQAEIEASKNFKGVMNEVKQKTGFKEAQEKAMREMKELGMSPTEYYSHILKKEVK